MFMNMFIYSYEEFLLRLCELGYFLPLFFLLFISFVSHPCLFFLRLRFVNSHCCIWAVFFPASFSFFLDYTLDLAVSSLAAGLIKKYFIVEYNIVRRIQQSHGVLMLYVRFVKILFSFPSRVYNCDDIFAKICFVHFFPEIGRERHFCYPTKFWARENEFFTRSFLRFHPIIEY